MRVVVWDESLSLSGGKKSEGGQVRQQQGAAVIIMSRQSGRISADPKRVNSELFTLTYGSLLGQLVRDSDGNVEEVNKNLDRIGYNIGMRLIEDYLARQQQTSGGQVGGAPGAAAGGGSSSSSSSVTAAGGRCNDLKDTAERIQAALRLYVSLSSSLSMSGGDEFTLTFDSCPFAEFVELPDALLDSGTSGGGGLKYANVLPGIVRGACEMVQMEVAAWIEKDTLKGDSVTELKVKFMRKLHDALPAGED